ATHVPLGELQTRVGDLPEAEQLFVVCRGGGRSARATVWLQAHGIDAVNIEGGMMSWAAARRPMVSESGQAPEVL
ncbi:MAG: rhodanese-like domain-containing protein, partial [Geodermatophilaceae bacterium]|nr:rhodanese-like domain-containing protein [Geodermatophilaceae bacterium]